MEANFDTCMRFVFAREDGYVDDPRDDGGATNLGVTLAVLRAWRGHAVSKTDVKRLSAAEARAIYHARYWLPAWCPDLPSGIDLLTFDAAVNMGIEPSLNLIREHVGVPIKQKNAHHIFVNTDRHLLMLAEAPIKDRLSKTCMPGAIVGICGRREARYRSYKKFPTFGRGWLNRVSLAQRAAMRLWVTDGKVFIP